MRGQDETNTSSHYEREQSIDECLCRRACMYLLLWFLVCSGAVITFPQNTANLYLSRTRRFKVCVLHLYLFSTNLHEDNWCVRPR